MIAKPPSSHIRAYFKGLYSKNQAMAGGVIYETPQSTPTQELMTDWTSTIAGMSGPLRREKEK